MKNASTTLLFLVLYLTIFIGYIQNTSIQYFYILGGMILFLILYLFASIKKMNQTPLIVMIIASYSFSELKIYFQKGTQELNIFFFVQVMISIVIICDFLFLRKDLKKGEFFKL
ncbi:MAG: hypothetical protein WCP74_04170 [Sphingobacteriia bacterium]|jgi:ABC-type Fe3+-siderophore transport system permease subunit